MLAIVSMPASNNLERKKEEAGAVSVTMLRQSCRMGDSSALDRVAEIVDRELRRLAGSKCYETPTLATSRARPEALADLGRSPELDRRRR
jgi:hypothetical protein